MDNSTQNELLMRYLDGELDGQEKLDFEKALASNAALQQRLEDLQTARQALRIYGLKQQVRDIHQQMIDESRPGGNVRHMSSTRRIVRYSISIAASILLLAVGIVGYNFLTVSSEKLY